MATKQFYHDIDLVKVGQLIDARIKNVDNTAESTLAGTLGPSNVGLVIYNTDLDTLKIWNGTAFQSVSADVTGDVIFQGVINPTNADTGSVVATAGHQYVVDVAGTLSKTGVTFNPSAVVEVGDLVLFTSATTATVLQRNIEDATTSQKGQVELATLAETNAGTDTTRAVTPASLADVLTDISTNASNIATNTSDIATNTSDIATNTSDIATNTSDIATNAANIATNTSDIAINTSDIATNTSDIATNAANIATNTSDIATNAANIATNTSDIATLQARDNILAYTATVNVTAGTPFTVNHELGLQDKDYFTIRVCDSGGSSVSVDVDSVDVNNLTITSLVSLTGLKVFILGI